MTTVQELVTFFEAIPADQWCIHVFEKLVEVDENGKEHVQRCALGHYNHHLCGNAIPSTEDNYPQGAYGPCTTPIEEMGLNPLDFIMSNNGVHVGGFNTLGDDPKSRVLAFLDGKLKEKA